MWASTSMLPTYTENDAIPAAPTACRLSSKAGWPVSVPADLPSLGLPACGRRDQSGCVVSWQSFAEPADPKLVTDVYDKSSGRTGIARAGSPMLCTNPLTGAPGALQPPVVGALVGQRLRGRPVLEGRPADRVVLPDGSVRTVSRARW